MASAQKEIFIAYDFGHINEACLQAERGVAVVCLDFFADRECKKRDIPYISLRDLVDGETGEGEWWALTHEIAREWYRLPAMKFFEYRGIPIAEAPEPIMQEYLARLFYYLRIYLNLKKIYPNASLSIPTPVVDNAPTASCFASFMPWAVVDAARMAGLEITPRGERMVPKTYSFPETTWKSLAMRVYNLIISLAPRRGFKIYASEYWGHFAPVVPYMDDTEIILFESRKFFKIPWRQIIKHRIRAMYAHGAMSGAEERAVRRIGEKFLKEWKGAKKEVAAYFARVRKDIDWSTVLEACEYLMGYAPRIIADIRSLHRIMEKERPDIVLQMASVGGPQHYFFLMACVARELKIPSLELQHAGATIDPRSVYCRIETDYLATYGEDVNLWHERIGHARNRLIPVGSPRFDRYVNERIQGIEKGKQLFTELGLDANQPVLIIIVPFSDTFATALDSYELAEFFKTVRLAQEKTPGLQVLFKFRSYRHIGGMKEYVLHIFPSDRAIAGDEDIFALLCASDAVVCNNTTTIYQAVLAGKPLILYAWKAFDTFHAKVYQQAAPLFYAESEFTNAITRIFTDEQYRNELLLRETRFLENYSFDGKSSERVAKLLRDLPRRYRERNPR